MKIKLDENMPARLVEVLAQLEHETETTPQEELTGQKDQDIWDVAQRDGYFLITQDLDISDIRLFTPGTHMGLSLSDYVILVGMLLRG